MVWFLFSFLVYFLLYYRFFVSWGLCGYLVFYSLNALYRVFVRGVFFFIGCYLFFWFLGLVRMVWTLDIFGYFRGYLNFFYVDLGIYFIFIRGW